MKLSLAIFVRHRHKYTYLVLINSPWYLSKKRFLGGEEGGTKIALDAGGKRRPEACDTLVAVSEWSGGGLLVVAQTCWLDSTRTSVLRVEAHHQDFFSRQLEDTATSKDNIFFCCIHFMVTA